MVDPLDTAAAHSGSLALEPQALDRLERRIERALRWARRDRRQAIASVTVPVAAGIDPSATVLLARRAGDRFFCFEQPARDGHAVCGLGRVANAGAAGPDRFTLAAAACRELAGRTVGERMDTDPDAPAGAGPVFIGGFAFAPDGGRAPEWEGFESIGLDLPELSIVRRGHHARLTVNVAVDGDESARALLERVQARLSEVVPATMPLLDPDPIERPRIAGAAPPSHYEEAVRRGVERIRAGELEKVVLAREVRVHAPAAIEPAPVLGMLREAFPECYCYCVGSPSRTLVGASPELLVRRDGATAQTVALAGTTRRSADPAVDDHLGQQLLISAKNADEHSIVARGIERELQPVSVWVTAAPDPVLVKVQNVQHLATPIRAQLADAVAALELAGRLHPTPAVGGEPHAVAEPLIPALEGFDRGWYAGGVGWTDLAEDGEFCVALRCALLTGAVARLYAGCGIVGDSVPAEELAETESKLAALLPLLT